MPESESRAEARVMQLLAYPPKVLWWTSADAWWLAATERVAIEDCGVCSSAHPFLVFASCSKSTSIKRGACQQIRIPCIAELLKDKKRVHHGTPRKIVQTSHSFSWMWPNADSSICYFAVESVRQMCRAY